MPLDPDLEAALKAMEERLMGRLNANHAVVLTALGAIRDDLTVLGGANDRVRKAGENTREEAREVAASLATVERVLLQHGTRIAALEQRLTKDGKEAEG